MNRAVLEEYRAAFEAALVREFSAISDAQPSVRLFIDGDFYAVLARVNLPLDLFPASTYVYTLARGERTLETWLVATPEARPAIMSDTVEMVVTAMEGATPDPATGVMYGNAPSIDLEEIEAAAQAQAVAELPPPFKPLGERALIEPIPEDRAFAGGELLLPESADKGSQRGRVLAVADYKHHPAGTKISGIYGVNVGDIVLYAKYAGTEIKLNGRKLLIVKEGDILGVLSE